MLMLLSRIEILEKNNDLLLKAVFEKKPHIQNPKTKELYEKLHIANQKMLAKEAGIIYEYLKKHFSPSILEKFEPEDYDDLIRVCSALDFSYRIRHCMKLIEKYPNMDEDTVNALFNNVKLFV